MRFDLLLIGFGHVARRFAGLLGERAEVLAGRYQLDARIAGIATARHGCCVTPDGVPGGEAVRLVEAGQSLEPLHDRRQPTVTSASELIDLLATLSLDGIPVVVETTTLDIKSGQPAVDHVRRALERGAHVITANKGPVAFAYAELRDLAAQRERSFLFEGAVMDGIPVFNLVRETLPAVQVTGFRGVLNSTTNHILTAMEAGQPFDEALAEMQRAGIAEADASLDVDGWDAAAKTAALINVLMDGRVTPHDIVRTGIAHVSPADLQAARERGRRIRLVASAALADGRAKGVVAPAELPASDPLAALQGQSNALILTTDLLGDLAITQIDAGLTHTAYALLSDLVAIRKRS